MKRLVRWFRAGMLVWRCRRSGHVPNSIVGHPYCEHWEAFKKLYEEFP